MSDAKSTTTAAPVDSKAPEKAQNPPQLGALEEDDEFEEFVASDWKDEDTDVSKLLQTGGASSGGKSNNLWEDNWDDDDVEDDFSKQLREELAKANSGGDTAMQT